MGRSEHRCRGCDSHHHCRASREHRTLATTRGTHWRRSSSYQSMRTTHLTIKSLSTTQIATSQSSLLSQLPAMFWAPKHLLNDGWSGAENDIKTLIDASHSAARTSRHPVAQRRLSGLWRHKCAAQRESVSSMQLELLEEMPAFWAAEA